MRWVFTFIVIINAVAFWWYSSQSERDSSAKGEISSAELKNIPSLVLLSERNKVPAGRVSQSVAAEDVVETPEPEVEAETESVSRQVSSENEAVKEEPVEEQGVGEEIAVAKPGAEIVPATAQECIDLGPFSEVISARQVKLRLSSLDIPANIETRKIAIDPVYWVYLEPSENRGKALALLRELQNKRIDSFLISEGEFANGISLGFFRQQSSADELQQKRIEQGYDAKIRIKERYKDRFWLTLSAESAAKFSDSLMSKLLSEYNYLQKKENSCDRVASTPNIE